MYKHLTQKERYYIWHRSVSLFESVEQIATGLNRHKSTIYNELRRNKDNDNEYAPDVAQVKSEANRSGAKLGAKFAKFTPKVCTYVMDKLGRTWSPEQISGRMRKDIKVKISHKSIYQYIWFDKSIGGSMYKKLPHRGKRYKYGNQTKVKIPNRVDISKRPKIVEKKSRIGDFEGDTIVGIRGGSKNCLLTLADRKSKLCFIRRTLDKSAKSIQNTMESVYDDTTVPFKTVTYDNGTEFCSHQEIAASIGCSIYFARPYRSCDRGLNEHTNGLIRYFFPKKTDFAKITDEQIAFVENLLNNRPRKSLGYLTPNEVMNKYLNRIYTSKH